MKKIFLNKITGRNAKFHFVFNAYITWIEKIQRYLKLIDLTTYYYAYAITYNTSVIAFCVSEIKYVMIYCHITYIPNIWINKVNIKY